MRLSESETSRNTGRHETTSLVKWVSAAKLAENLFGCEQTGRRPAKRRRRGAGRLTSRQPEEEIAMTQIRTLLIGTAMTAFAATAAVAQTSQPVQPIQPAAGVNTQAQLQAQTPGADVAPAAPAAQGVQPVTPPPTRLTAPGSADPLVQKREANAKASAEYRASKKASKAELKQQQKAAKSEYTEQVRDAKINMKADKQAASNEMKMNMQGQAGAQTDGGEVKH